MLTLRPYQQRAVQDILGYACEHLSGRLLIVLPPGGGKTAIMAEVLKQMAAEQGLRGLAWAHRRELVVQMWSHLVACGVPEEMIGVVMAGDPRVRPDALIQVSSVETIQRREKPPADIVVSDEAHRDASVGRRKLRAAYPDALHVGFTASPVRLAGGGLRKDYDHMLVVAQPSELIADGYLAAPIIYTVPPELLPDVGRVRRRGGDFELDELERATNKRALIGSIVEHWQRLAEGRRTIVFPVGIRHSKAIVARFRDAGVAAEHLDGETPTSKRVAMLADLAAGRIKVVSSCGVLSEGVDIPSVKCVVMARPTESLPLVIQQGGRCMRPWEGVTPLILDHAGNVVRQRHGAPHADRPWSLDAPKRTGGGITPMKPCASCGMVVYAALRTCPGCGNSFDASPVEPTEATGTLVKYDLGWTTEQKSKELQRLQAFAMTRSIPTEWVERVYRAKFMEAPNLSAV
jgi:DNA repair protein RadD